MGTEYKLYEDKLFGSLSIGEMSNRLELIFDDLIITGFTRVKPPTNNDPSVIITKRMTPEEMAKIMLKGLTVCSYWMDTDELKELIKKHMNKEIY